MKIALFAIAVIGAALSITKGRSLSERVVGIGAIVMSAILLASNYGFRAAWLKPALSAASLVVVAAAIVWVVGRLRKTFSRKQAPSLLGEGNQEASK